MDLIQDAIRNLNEPGTIIYIDTTISFHTLPGTLQKRGKIEGYIMREKRVLSLTKREVRFLDKAFANDSSFAWPEALFQNSVRTSEDSAQFIQNYIAGIEKGKLRKRYFYFNRPIYFRDHSYAVFRLAAMFERAAGTDYLFFYRRVGLERKLHMWTQTGSW